MYHNHPVDSEYWEGGWDMIGKDQRKQGVICKACAQEETNKKEVIK